MAKNKKKAKCIVCQGGSGAYLCPLCKKSLAGLQRKNHNAVVFDEDIARWAARRGAAALLCDLTEKEVDRQADLLLDRMHRCLQELLPHLAWSPHSAHHSGEVKRILNELLWSRHDLSKELEEFNKVCLQPPQEGSPKQPVKQLPMTPAEAYALLRECEPAMLAELAKEQADSSDNEEVLAVMADGLVSVSFRVAQRAFDAGCMVKQFRGPGVGYTLAETRPVEGKDYAILGTQAQRILDSIPDTVEEST